MSLQRKNDSILTHRSVSKISRRRFIKMLVAGAGAVLGATACGAVSSVTTAAKNNRVGLQLYTLRSMMAESVTETLKLVASVGYKELEFAGLYNNEPKDVKALMDRLGLKAPSTHVLLKSMSTEAEVEKQIDIAKIMGHKYVVVPYISPEDRSSNIAGYQRLAERLNTLGETFKASGIQLAYHNHDFEFEDMNGQLPYDVLLDECDSDLLTMELDLYWTVKAGLNPVDYFKRNPGRFELWHVKDMDARGEFADVGKGIINFDDIFAHGDLSGIKHKFVECDKTEDMVETIKQGYQSVSRLNGKY